MRKIKDILAIQYDAVKELGKGSSDDAIGGEEIVNRILYKFASLKLKKLMNKFDKKLGRVYTGKFKDVKSSFPLGWENRTIVVFYINERETYMCDKGLNNSHYMAELLERIEYKGVSCYVNEDTIIIQI